jgi:Putative Actinobacterial Holin-X, holin superfamily III
MQAHEESRGIGELLGDLGRQVSTLVRREIDLARVEITSSIGHLGKGAATAGIGGAIVYAGVLVLLASIVLGLIEAGLDGWLAALIVAVAALAIGGFVTWLGTRQIREVNLAPAQTAETVRENVEFVKEQIK